MKITDLSPEEQAMSQVAKNVVEVPMDNFLHNNYLPYAYYVIRNRALVGADGLKPVQKRILYSMYLNRIMPTAKHVKASKVAANTMGDFHPHGNVSIEDALARMGQNFNLRVPLIDPYGSVGYYTGERAAAARYWEARLTKAAVELLKELDDKALPMGKNYDGSLDEPAILPARWPAVLINGTEGIAVGYASKIFPHNPTEVMNAAIELVKNPDLTMDELLKIMPGPDFPTGGELIGLDTIGDVYEAGSGSFTLRGRYEVRPLTRGRTNIIFYELPYQVSADMVIKEIKKVQKSKNLMTYINEMKDLSDGKNGLRLSFNLKAGTNVDLAIEEVFKNTSASKNYSLNETVLESGAPSQLDIFEVFRQFLDLRKLVLVNVTNAKIERVEKEYSNNSGLIKVLKDLDKAIEIIKTADTAEIARTNLMSHFGIIEEQAEYILSLRLRKLTRSDRTELFERNEALAKELEELNEVLEDPEVFKQLLISELEKTREVISDKRRTIINSKTTEEIKAEEQAAKVQATALSKNAPYELTMFADGKLVKQLLTADTAAPDVKVPSTYKLQARTEDQLFAVLRTGAAIKFPSSYIPFNRVVNKESLGLEQDFIAIGKQADKGDLGMLVVTTAGRIVIVSGNFPTTMDEFTLVNLDEGEEIMRVLYITKDNKNMDLTMVTSDGYITAFPVSTLRVSRSGVQPIKGMAVNENAKVVGANLTSGEGKVLTITRESLKVTDLAEIPVKSRGTKGVIIQKQNAKFGDIIDAYASSELRLTDKLGNEMFLPEKNPRAAAAVKFPTLGLIVGDKF